MSKKKGINMLPLIYAIFGVYLLNHSLGFLDVPGFILTYEKWIISFGGVLLFVAMYRMIVYSKKRIIKRAFKGTR
jgi:hypothetical protein